jgi:regulator of sirC expression with transglutaminase-like and TPR domain
MYFQTGNLVQGLADIQRALELRPDDAASLDTRAHIYEAMNRRADAIVDYKHVLTLIPETHPNAQPTRDALKRLSAPTQ